MVTELNLKNFGAFGDGKSHMITQAQLETRGWTGKYQVGEQWDTIAWQEATSAATAGMTINVPKGTYLVSGQLPLKSDVQWVGKSATFQSVGADAVVLKYSSPLQNVTIRGITFQNLAFEFRGSTQESINNLRFESCAFNGCKNPADKNGSQIYLIRTSDVTFNDCSFSRDKKDVGRGLTIYQSRDAKVLDSSWSGYYITAIIVNGVKNDPATGAFPDAARSVNTLISGNTIKRSSGSFAEDHGIYATGMRGITIENNTISGWSTAATGGAVKIRNGEDVVIRDNKFNKSGILMYTYKEDGTVPEYFKNVLVEGNTITFEKKAKKADSQTGIYYWRNFGKAADPVEQNIVIRNNTITKGIVYIVDANLPAFTITGNTAAGYFTHPQKIDLTATNTVK